MARKIIKLSAWGQNAHFLKNQVIQANTSWPNDLPYVIYGGLRVDSNATLTIQPGTHIYMHADAPVYIDGSLNVLGIRGTVRTGLFYRRPAGSALFQLSGILAGYFFQEIQQG